MIVEGELDFLPAAGRRLCQYTPVSDLFVLV